MSVGMAASMSENFSERNTMNLDVHQQEIKYITVLIVSTFYFEWKAGDLITCQNYAGSASEVAEPARAGSRAAKILSRATKARLNDLQF